MKSSQRFHLHRLAEKLVTPERYGSEFRWPFAERRHPDARTKRLHQIFDNWRNDAEAEALIRAIHNYDPEEDHAA